MQSDTGSFEMFGSFFLQSNLLYKKIKTSIYDPTTKLQANMHIWIE